MGTILLADDDGSMREFIRRALENDGHVVQDADNGLSALDVLTNVPAGTFDLLLTDIVMPGIDGIELSKKASRHDGNIKTMFITGFTAMTANTSQTITKPFHLKELTDQINTLLQQN